MSFSLPGNCINENAMNMMSLLQFLTLNHDNVCCVWGYFRQVFQTCRKDLDVWFEQSKDMNLVYIRLQGTVANFSSPAIQKWPQLIQREKSVNTPRQWDVLYALFVLCKNWNRRKRNFCVVIFVMSTKIAWGSGIENHLHYEPNIK